MALISGGRAACPLGRGPPGGSPIADVASAREGRRAFARVCIDWSERRPHLAGALGAAVADALFANGWLKHCPNDRTLTVTPAGAAGLGRELGIEVGRTAA